MLDIEHRIAIVTLCHIKFHSDWQHLLIFPLNEFLTLLLILSRHVLLLFVDSSQLLLVGPFDVLCSFCISIMDILFNPLLFKLPDSLSDIVLLSALKTSLNHSHLLLLRFFDFD